MNTNTNARLVALPAMPGKARKQKDLRDCACGCGRTTQSRFAPGHDARLLGWTLRVERGLLTFRQILDLAGRNTAKAVWIEARKLRLEQALNPVNPNAQTV